MQNLRRWVATADCERTRVFELALVVFLWQAAVGVYVLSLVQQYLPRELNTGMAYPGYAMASYGVARFLWQTPAGWIADRIGRRLTMAIGMAVNLPVLALMMEVPDERAFLVLSAALGIGAATMWPAFMAHVGETTPRGRRARTMSLVNIAQMAGIGAGTLAGVLMVDFVTYTGAFWVCIAFSFLALLMAARHTRASAADPVPAPLVEAAPPARQPTRERAGWAPGIAMLALIVLFLTVGTSIHTPVISAYTRDFLDVKMSFLALLFPAPAAVAGIVMWKFGHLTDRYGRQVPLVGGLVVAAVCIFALTLTNSPYIVVNLVVLAGLAYAISVPAWGAAALDATDAGSRGLLLGALTAVQGLGVAGGQALGGVVGDEWGPLAPFKLGALMLMVAVALIVSHHAFQSRARRQIAVRAVGIPIID